MTGHVERVALRVADLDRMVEFYADVIGLETLDRAADRAVLGVDDPRLVLLAAPDRPPAGRTRRGSFTRHFGFPRGRRSATPRPGSRSGGASMARRTTTSARRSTCPIRRTTGSKCLATGRGRRGR
jgi:catechol 2,3-dioxygenase-like lactoylglutathione lyase family enzyme